MGVRVKAANITAAAHQASPAAAALAIRSSVNHSFGSIFARNFPSISMVNPERKNHWEDVYRTKSPDQVSWTQAVPSPSLEMIRELRLPHSAPIIDVGGGDSQLVDFLLAEGFTDITVLDISSEALARAKQRLGEQATRVTWVVADITEFAPQRHYAVWHDRAVFHFLTKPEEIAKYVATVSEWVTGFLVIGTFGTDGPRKCSGLDVTQYSASSLSGRFNPGFVQTGCRDHSHQTPFGTVQRFVFCTLAAT